MTLQVSNGWWAASPVAEGEVVTHRIEYSWQILIS